MTLQEFCDTLSKKKQIQLAILLIEKVLPLWNKYAEENSLAYRDSVAGMDHNVPKELIHNTISEIKNHITSIALIRFLKSKTKLMKLRSYFDDPIIALQDLDWEVPQPIEKTFYSAYNLLEAFLGKQYASSNEKTIYISINQAIDALQSEKILTEIEIKEILSEFKRSNNVTSQS
jgi:hypothetical protein